MDIKLLTQHRKLIIFSVFCLPFIFSMTSAHSRENAKANTSTEIKRVIEHWTKERRAKAIPRDLVIDKQGKGYLRKPDGSLMPYGHTLSQLTAKKPIPLARPPGAGGDSSDITPPIVSSMSPAQGDSISTSAIFTATVTDNASGIKSVSFVIIYPDNRTQSFNPAFVGNDNWEITLSGFSNGNWAWYVVAKDGATKGGNSTTSSTVNFTVDTGSSSGGGGDTGSGDSHVITNSAWTSGGAIQNAAGRIYFEMPGNERRKGPWSAYVCSGAVATDDTTGRSVIITAAHCVYDDANKAFARNVLFIPNQDGTTGSDTDTNCSNDPLGCWAADFGVVDVNWASNTFPNNIEWDYAYYVVSDSGAHKGTSTSSNSLDVAAGSLAIDFTAPNINDGDPSANSADFTHALGYSYSDDPNFMYCAEDITTEGTVNWWLASCGLSGGSSGGPWIQPMDTTSGSGLIISVNSWGYTTSAGMAGPKLSVTTASCLFTEAKGISFASIPATDGDTGIVIDYCQ